MRNFFRGFYLVISVIVLASCGGGGGSSTPEPPPTPPPTPPTSTPPDCALSAQNTYYCTMTRKGLSRELYIYIPDSYSENGDPVPLLFSLHGYTSRAIWNLGYTGFRTIADEEGFIVIYPQGSILPSTGQTHWNVGGWTTSSTTDDVDFIESLIDWTGANFNINLDRVYSTGMSNGGFMSYHLVCNLSSKVLL
jgi:Poly(3-hydroxybutyrate) depolymerase